MSQAKSEIQSMGTLHAEPLNTFVKSETVPDTVNTELLDKFEQMYT